MTCARDIHGNFPLGQCLIESRVGYDFLEAMSLGDFYKDPIENADRRNGWIRAEVAASIATLCLTRSRVRMTMKDQHIVRAKTTAHIDGQRQFSRVRGQILAVEIDVDLVLDSREAEPCVASRILDREPDCIDPVPLTDPETLLRALRQPGSFDLAETQKDIMHRGRHPPRIQPTLALLGPRRLVQQRRIQFLARSEGLYFPAARYLDTLQAFIRGSRFSRVPGQNRWDNGQGNSHRPPCLLARSSFAHDNILFCSVTPRILIRRT